MSCACRRAPCSSMPGTPRSRTSNAAHRLGLTFSTTLKANRLVSRSPQTGYVHLDTLDWTAEQLEHGLSVKLKELPFRVRLFKVVATNGDIDWVITNDPDEMLTTPVAQTTSDVRWQIEELHRGLQQLTGTAQCQCRSARSQRTHIACCYHAWVSLKVHAKRVGKTLYQVRADLFREYLRAESTPTEHPGFHCLLSESPSSIRVCGFRPRDGAEKGIGRRSALHGEGLAQCADARPRHRLDRRRPRCPPPTRSRQPARPWRQSPCGCRRPPPDRTWGSAVPIIARSCSILGSILVINSWPPKPGSTVMQSARSMSPRISCSMTSGVAGLIATPAFLPNPFMAATVRCRCGEASWCTMMTSCADPRAAGEPPLRLDDHQRVLPLTSVVVAAHRLDDQRSHGDVGDKAPVHHVHLHTIGAAALALLPPARQAW